VSGVEAAKLIAPGAAKLAAQEAAKVIAFLVEDPAWQCRRDLRASLITGACGDDGRDARRRPN
jgi:hypothetical protein